MCYKIKPNQTKQNQSVNNLQRINVLNFWSTSAKQKSSSSQSHISSKISRLESGCHSVMWSCNLGKKIKAATLRTVDLCISFSIVTSSPSKLNNVSGSSSFHLSLRLCDGAIKIFIPGREVIFRTCEVGAVWHLIPRKISSC